MPARDHPSLDIVSSSGTELSGRRIVLCVSGSVAAYKAIELARLLMRHGADVTCVASKAVTGLIRPDYLKWATGNDVITKLTGRLEHIRIADYGASDIIIVYPATANTLGKLANGIDDTPVSTVLTVGFGAGIPILMCLAMHESMYENPAVRRNMDFLRGKIRFLDPQMIEGKAKAPEPERVLGHVLERFGSSPVLRGKRILITAGPTMEYVDPVRVITNRSSGRTGALLASELISAGARVTMICGRGSHAPPRGARVVNADTGREMHDAVRRALRVRFDAVIMAAAVSDYAPQRAPRSKIKSSGESLVIRLRRTPKIIDMARRAQKDALLIGFKAETDVSKETLVRRARRKMKESGADAIVANDIGERYQKNPGKNEVLFVDAKGAVSSGYRPKEKIAAFLKREIEKRLR